MFQSKKPKFVDMPNLTKKVKFLLETIPNSRDNDMTLVSSFYMNEIGNEAIKTMSAFELLHKFSCNELPSSETLLRVKRHLQKTNESLRGNQYKKKKDKPKYEYIVRNKD